MSAPNDDGGLAFPIVFTAPAEHCGVVYGEVYSEGGMSLRDYFAAAALQGILPRDFEVYPKHVSARAYEVADAMLAERAKGGGK